IFDGNRHGERLGTDPVAGFFCGEIFHPKTFTSETNMVEIFFHVDSYDENTYFTFDSRAEQEQDLYARFGQNPEMFPHRRGISVKGTYCERVFQDCRADTCYVQSPGYPGVYLRNLRCSYKYHVDRKLEQDQGNGKEYSDDYRKVSAKIIPHKGYFVDKHGHKKEHVLYEIPFKAEWGVKQKLPIVQRTPIKHHY
ncbi:unnamed protein product, partial [Cyprideis torosa]